MHALIIEDIAIIAFAMEDLLLELGYMAVDIACSKAEALALAAVRCPDLIIADYRLTDGTGVEAVKEICRSYGDIPAIYTAGLVDEVIADVPTALVLEKPVDNDTLRASVIAASAL